VYLRRWDSWGKTGIHWGSRGEGKERIPGGGGGGGGCCGVKEGDEEFC
jgi:hypothetical protein